MTKRTITLILLLLCSAFLNAQSLFTDLPGSFVIYDDQRFGDQAYIGLLYLGEDSILVRTYEEATGTEFVFITKLKDDNGDIAFDEDMNVLAGAMTDSDTTQRIFPMVLNWGSGWLKSRDKIRENLTWSETHDDAYSYKYWIPVFNIENIEDSSDFRLLTVGYVRDINDPAFAQFAGIPENSGFDSYEIRADEGDGTYVSDLDLTLDSNWIKGDDGIYRIQNQTVQDAAFMKEEINLEGTPFANGPDLAKFMMIANSGAVVLADQSDIFYDKDSVVVENRVLDSRTNVLTFQRMKIAVDGKVATMVSFASFLDLYNDNAAYFDKLIK